MATTLLAVGDTETRTHPQPLHFVWQDILLIKIQFTDMRPRADWASACVLLTGLLGVIFVMRRYRHAEGISVIVVPGGGLLEDGSLPPHSLKRVEKAVELYWADPSSVIVTLSAGTTHKPNPRDQFSFPLYESSAALKYLVSKGIPTENILEEKLSLDTIGNVSSSKYWRDCIDLFCSRQRSCIAGIFF